MIFQCFPAPGGGGVKLPEGIEKFSLTRVTFSESRTAAEGADFPHTLGVAPDFFLIFAPDVLQENQTDTQIFQLIRIPDSFLNLSQINLRACKFGRWGLESNLSTNVPFQAEYAGADKIAFRYTGGSSDLSDYRFMAGIAYYVIAGKFAA